MFLNYTENSTFYFFSTGAQSVASIVGLSAAIAVFRYQCFLQDIAEKRQYILDIIKEFKLIGTFGDSQQVEYSKLTCDKERVEWWREILKNACENGLTEEQNKWFVNQRFNEKLAETTDEQNIAAINKQIALFRDTYLQYTALNSISTQAAEFKKQILALTKWGLVLVGYGIVGTLAPVMSPCNIVGQVIAKAGFLLLLVVYLVRLYKLIVQAFNGD